MGNNATLYLSDEEHAWLVSTADLERQLEQHGPHALMAEWYYQIIRRAHECWGCRVLCVSRQYIRWLAAVNRFAKKLDRARNGPVRWEAEQ